MAADDPKRSSNTHPDYWRLMQLPVVETLQELLNASWARRNELVRATILPAIAIAGMYFYMTAATIPRDLDGFYRWLAVLVVLVLLSSLCWALLAVSTHRVLLDDPDKPTIVDGIRLGARQITYIAKALVVAAPLAIYGFVVASRGILWSGWSGSLETLSFVATAAEWAVLIPSQYISSRVSLVLPAASLNRKMTFKDAWGLTRGNGWRITAVLLAIPAATEILWLVQYLALPIEGQFVKTIWILISVVSGVLIVGALSFSYNWIINRSEN